MVNYADKALFEQTSIDKQFHIYTDDETISITNKDLFLGEFTLNESLCSEESLQIGACEASSVMFTAANNFGSLKGKWLNIEIELAGAETPFFLGRYKVFSDKPTSHRARREVVAYDALYDAVNADATDWYLGLWNNVTTTMSIKDFRDSFFTFIGITQETTTLINDTYMILPALGENEMISGGEVLKEICRYNGVFGHIGRDGVFHYISLLKGTTYAIDNSQQKDSDYEEFITQAADSVVAYNTSGAIVARAGTTPPSNPYNITDSIFITSQTENEVLPAMTRLLSQIIGVTYRPFSGDFNGNPCYEVGDYISFNDRSSTIPTFLLERTMTGIQALSDSYESKGTLLYPAITNSGNTKVSNALRQINEIKENLETSELQVYIVKNFDNIAITDGATQKVITINFTTVDTSAVVFDIQIDFTAETTSGYSSGYDVYNDLVLKALYYYDNTDLMIYPQDVFFDGKHILTLHFAIPSLTVSTHKFEIYLNAVGGQVTIPALGCLVIMTGNGLASEEGWDGIITASDEIDNIYVGDIVDGYIASIVENADVENVTDQKNIVSDIVPKITKNMFTFYSSMSDSVTIEQEEI